MSKIKEVGSIQQGSTRKYITFKRKRIKVLDKVTGSSLILFPDDGFSIHNHVEFKSNLLKHQDAVLENLGDFTREIATSRTLVFVKEIEPLLNKELT